MSRESDVPPSKKLKLDHEPSKAQMMQTNPSELMKDSDDKFHDFVTPEELEKLKEFKVLDEIKSNDEDSNDEDSDSSDGKSDGLPEEEIEKMLEEDLPEGFKGVPKPKEKPYITRQKIVLEEKGVNYFEVLPLDWMMVRHYSGMPVYMHRGSRVCTLAKPYFLGKGNTRRHDIPISAIPCLAYRRALQEEEKQKKIDRKIQEQIKSGTWVSNMKQTEQYAQSAANNELNIENCDNELIVNEGERFSPNDLIIYDNKDSDFCNKSKDISNFKTDASNQDIFLNIELADNDSKFIGKDINDSNKILDCKKLISKSKCPHNDGNQSKKEDEIKNVYASKCPFMQGKMKFTDKGLITKPDTGNIAEDKDNINEAYIKVIPENQVIIKKSDAENTSVTRGIKKSEFGNAVVQDDTIKPESKTVYENEVVQSETEDMTVIEGDIKNVDAEHVVNQDDIKKSDAENVTVNQGDNNEPDIEETVANQGVLEKLDTECDNEDNEGDKQKSDTNTDSITKEIPLNRQPVVLPGGIVMPPPRVETVNTSWKTQHLTHEQVNDYCKKLFKFKTVNIMHFMRWADRRKYTKARKTLQYPTLPEGTKLITIPAQPVAGQDNGGKSTKRDWVMNMNGRSYLSVFHEYVRRALQQQPVYEFKQLENASSPYQATVYIGGMQYGVGHGSSKRQAKSAAARASIHILIPEMRDEIDAHAQPPSADAEPDFTFFDYVGIEDPRITEFCAATCEPSPHAILRTCLLRNFGAGDRHIHTEMRKLEYQKIELTMKVGKHSATVVCKNKKTAKQRASQSILQALHPHVRSWGSLLRLYGSRSVKSCKEKKVEEQQITLLQDQAQHNAPNLAVLRKLRHEMRRLQDRDRAVVPIGTLLLAAAPPTHSASHLNHVEL